MDNYRIVLYLSDMTMELPVLPDKISVKRALDSSEKTVLELGNVNILKGAKLRQISFSSLFPAERIPAVSVRQKIHEPLWYARKLRGMMESRCASFFSVRISTSTRRCPSRVSSIPRVTVRSGISNTSSP